MYPTEGTQTIIPTFHMAPVWLHENAPQPHILLQEKDPSTPGEDFVLCNFAEYAGQVERTTLRASVPSHSLSETSSSLCSFLRFFRREWLLQNSRVCLNPNPHGHASQLNQGGEDANGDLLLEACGPTSTLHRGRTVSALPGRPGWSRQSVLLL